jgi:hypothetical protein
MSFATVSIYNVSLEKAELKSIDNGSIITIEDQQILNVEMDHNSAELIITITKK